MRHTSPPRRRDLNSMPLTRPRALPGS